MRHHPDPAATGTLLRHVLELLDADVAEVYQEQGLPEYRPRFSPVVRALRAEGPLSVRDLAAAVGVTHSAASQTAAQMARAGLVTHTPDPRDARRRLVELTPKARALLPQIQAEWDATAAAMAALDAELSMPLGDLLAEVAQAVGRRPFRERIADAHGRSRGRP
ncbi:MarR family winged helix-turn-helix transcriptional regulator [Actinacidiphila bryophytorum]|uniref:MarR family transcriptional regulator n=1 Tax=Actinacidiphila bryophytorum TaxID=1436133 RepID=A0A9W4MI80_9ACTN|nr:MarR family transcriptional regulator [Actinacidiphila bryophytorum]MBM9437034.1 MarR family transcriptional regulator [Actinacidiphila bryophytorum]MBN6541716.1 MarR family transcriptional regulator [Actinacidiphila bryophytorum]CAG7646326.1 MarR family transcriptional regulator [Actinacidiphila bryophytorum]